MKGPSEDYISYLHSPQWKDKRGALIFKRGGKCEHCGFRRRLQVHHLTYDRLFSEDEADLMVLCSLCHEAVERGKDCFQIPRKGCVIELRARSLAWLVDWHDKPKPIVVTKEKIVYRERVKIVEKIVYVDRAEPVPKKERPPKEKKTKGGPRNPIQAELMADEGFMESVRTVARENFGSFIRGMGITCPKRWANAFVVFDRYHFASRKRIRPEDIANDGMMIPLTDELIESGRTDLGGLSNRQLGCIGVPVPPVSGWKKKAIGRMVTPCMLKSFLSGK